MATTTIKISEADYRRLAQQCTNDTVINYGDLSVKVGKVISEYKEKGVTLSLQHAYLIAYSDYIHQITIAVLKVPDHDDAELRILVGEDENGDEITKTSIDVMYTIGDNEYPKFKGEETFRPSEEYMINLAAEIQALARTNKDFHVGGVTVNAWENSTFIWRGEGEWSQFCDTTDGGPQEPDELKESVDLVIYMTEEMRNALRKKGGSGPEAANSVEEEFPLVGDFAQATKEKLGIKESGVESERKLNCRIVVPEFADVGVGVEVRTTDTLSRARQQALAEALKTAFENNEVTKDTEIGVEVWIKQGKEAISVVL